VQRDNDFADYLADRVRASDELELLAEPVLSICCFRYTSADVVDLDAFNATLFRRLVQETEFLPSSTVVNRQFSLRPCFINPRSEREHVDGLVDAVLRIGNELVAKQRSDPVRV
jgi:aromatic-L-amino-acid decarboxylase